MDKNYVIKVSGIESGNDEFVKSVTEGINCKGFAIITKNEDGATVLLHGVDIDDLGCAFSKNEVMMAAAALAEGRQKADRLMSSAKMREVFGNVSGLAKVLSTNDL